MKNVYMLKVIEYVNLIQFFFVKFNVKHFQKFVKGKLEAEPRQCYFCFRIDRSLEICLTYILYHKTIDTRQFF